MATVEASAPVALAFPGTSSHLSREDGPSLLFPVCSEPPEFQQNKAGSTLITPAPLYECAYMSWLQIETTDLL